MAFAGTEGFEQSRHERTKIEMRFAHLKRIPCRPLLSADIFSFAATSKIRAMIAME